ncbi:hypothetical protein NKDENANG_02205 [Candidatus Entotheonellaceae bacterium PAL068K]
MTRALRRASLVYLTTYGLHAGSGTVPIWFFQHQGAIYFCTQRQTIKVRRIIETGRATLHIGSRKGPVLECTAQVIEANMRLQAELIRAYRRRYPVRWLFLGGRIRRGFSNGTEIMVQLQPLTDKPQT